MKYTQGWKAQHRLYKTYHRIYHRKSSHIAVVAVARELVGFLEGGNAEVGGPLRDCGYRSTRRVSNHWRRKRIDVDVLDRYYSNGNIIIVSIPKLKYLL